MIHDIGIIGGGIIGLAVVSNTIQYPAGILCVIASCVVCLCLHIMHQTIFTSIIVICIQAREFKLRYPDKSMVLLEKEVKGTL
jgi:hypothetical protein